MRVQHRGHVRLGWLRAWLIQIAVMLAACLIASAAHGVGPAWLYGALLWVGAPLAGLATAYRAVRCGLLNYAAWIAPPACLYASHWLLWRYAPSAGAALLCAFTSLVGAAAGQVVIEQNRQRQKDKK